MAPQIIGLGEINHYAVLSKAPFGRREWNGIKGIFLEYSSLLLFESFNGENGMSIFLFGSLSGREWND